MTESTTPRPRRSPRPGERQRDPERTKRRILDAAKAEFGAKGYQAARVGDIADRAGVAKQLVSYYFGGKEGLYRELMTAMSQSTAMITAADQPLEAATRQFVRTGLSDRDMSRLFAWENLTDTGPGTFGEDEQREFLQHQVEYLRARQAAGDFPADLDPAHLLLILLTAATAPVAFPRVVRVVCNADPESEEFVNGYAEQLALLMRQLRPDR